MFFHRIAIVISFTVLIALSHSSFGQYYSLKLTPTQIELDTITLNGYSTLFKQPYKEVKKTWWKYIKSKAIIDNHITYYDLKIPDIDREANTDIYLVSQLNGTDSSEYRTLKLALRTHNLAEEEIESLNQEMKEMLVEFKTAYFVSSLQEKIEGQEKLAIKLSGQLEKLRTSKHREKMDPELFNAKESGLIYSMKQVDLTLESLKLQLLEIK